MSSTYKVTIVLEFDTFPTGDEIKQKVEKHNYMAQIKEVKGAKTWQQKKLSGINKTI